MTSMKRFKTSGLLHGSPLREKLDLQNVAAYLSDGWRRYVELFGEPPHGTVRQFLALLELSYVDRWQIMKHETQEGGSANA